MTGKVIGHLLGYPVIETDLKPNKGVVVIGGPLTELIRGTDRMAEWVRAIERGGWEVSLATRAYRTSETDRINNGMAFGL